MCMTSGVYRSVPVEFTYKPTVIRSVVHLLPLTPCPAHGLFHVMTSKEWISDRLIYSPVEREAEGRDLVKRPVSSTLKTSFGL